MWSWDSFNLRQHIGKFLIKLPSVFFPSYRLENIEIYSGNLENGSGDHLRQEEIQGNRRHTLDVPTPPSFPYHLANFQQYSTINNIAITSQNLKAVILRKTHKEIRKIETPASIRKVLKKRFEAIHSPIPNRLVFDDTDDFQ